MAQPKKQKSSRKTGMGRSHLGPALARKVNSALSRTGAKVQAYVSRRVSGKKAKA